MRRRQTQFKTVNSSAQHFSKGFTLIEILMVIAILSIAFGTIYKTFDTFNRAYTTENVVAGVQQKTRVGMEFMIQDIRLAGLDPLGFADTGITVAGVTSIEFTADRNMNGQIDDPDLTDGSDETSDLERIEYRYDGNNLLEMLLRKSDTTIESQDTLLDSVTGLTITYLDVDENDLINYSLAPPRVPTNQLADIRTVVISLTIQRPAGRDDPVSRTYTTRVRCRNL
jgi:prepilin-type N-terminal cleavage/methylation domain-containing protein